MALRTAAVGLHTTFPWSLPGPHVMQTTTKNWCTLVLCLLRSLWSKNCSLRHWHRWFFKNSSLTISRFGDLSTDPYRSLFRCHLMCYILCATFLFIPFYCATQICIARTCYGDVAGWLGGWVAGWLSVARRYYIKTAKLFRPSSSLIILVSFDPCGLSRYPIPRGIPSAGALNTGGRKNWRFSCDFRWKSPFISETVQDRPMVTMER